MNNMQNLYLLVPLAPLLGALVAGLFGKVIGRTWTHRFTILMVAISFAASVYIFKDVLAGNTFNGAVYQWISTGYNNASYTGYATIEVGFLIEYDCT